MGDLIAIEPQGRIMNVILNRPANFNAFNLEMITDLARQLKRLAMDDSVQGIVLTGAGKVFCAGGDLKWVMQFSERPGASFHTLAAQFHAAILEIRRMPKPVVAAVNGMAAGGGFSLALACDFRIMEKSAVLRQAYTSNGLCIDGGGSFTLPRLVGLARALEIMAFDEPIPSEQAFRWSLVTRVVEDGGSVNAAINLAQRIASGALNSFAWSKRLMTEAFGNTLETQLEIERQGLAECADHAQGREGLRAFSEKRKPDFTM